MTAAAADWEWLLALAAVRRAGRIEGADRRRFDWNLGPLYETFARRGGVIAQIGQSLDGRIATPTGHSHYVNDGPVIDHLHRLRALADVVVIGAGTAVADDPALTVRRVPGPNPVRALIDPRGRVQPGARLFCDGASEVLHLVGAGVDAHPGARRLEVAFDRPGACARIIEALHAAGHRAIFVEGGGRTVSAFLTAGMLDRLHVAVAPVIIGSGVMALDLPPIDRMDQALRAPCRRYRLGGDTLFDLDLSGVPAPDSGEGPEDRDAG